MAMFRVFRTPNPKKFNYKPRFYEPEEEEKQERRDRLRRMREKGAEGMKERISSGLRFRGGYTADRTARARAIRRSNLIMLAVVIFLIILSYGFIKVYLPEIMRALS